MTCVLLYLDVHCHTVTCVFMYSDVCRLTSMVVIVHYTFSDEIRKKFTKKKERLSREMS